MKKGQVGQGIVEKVVFPNKGVVYTEDGKQVIVKNTVPGQKISFSINKIRKGKGEGRLLEVLEKSPLELEVAACPHFGNCGGCTYQNLSYDEQLKLKEKQLRDLYEPVLKQDGKSFDELFEGIRKSPKVEGYRNKMEFSFGDSCKDGPLALGMHKRGSFYDIVDVEECRIVDEDYRKILKCVREYFAEMKIPFYHRMRHEGYLRHLLVRKAVKTGEILVDLVTSTQTEGWAVEEIDLLEGFKDRLLGLTLSGRFAGILHTKNDSVADVIRNDGTDILYGLDCLYEELLGLKFKITPFSFFQTNSLGAEVLYGMARDFIGDALKTEKAEGSTVFDLYSGTGTIAQILAPVAGKVIGVEIVKEAVEAAKENAAQNGLKNCDFMAGDVLKVIDEIEEKPDFIVLDPPREGIHPKALEKIIKFGVERMVYISCKPTSLARDLEVLQSRGYGVERIGGVDMFAGTVHVETVVLLSLKSGTPKIEVTMEVDSDSNYSPEEKATYQKIKEYVKDKYGVNVHTRYIAEVKRMCGIDMGENYNKSKKDEPDVKHCPPEKIEYIKEALKYFEVI